MAKSGRKKIRRNVARGVAFVKATFNNTMITITDTNGDTLCWASAGTVGFKGTRKSTPFAAQRAAERVAQVAKKFGLVASRPLPPSRPPASASRASRTLPRCLTTGAGLPSADASRTAGKAPAAAAGPRQADVLGGSDKTHGTLRWTGMQVV